MPINTTKILKWDDAPDLLKPQEAAKLMRIGKNKIYKVAAIKGFPKLTLGETHFLIPKEALLKWIEKQAQSN